MNAHLRELLGKPEEEIEEFLRELCAWRCSIHGVVVEALAAREVTVAAVARFKSADKKANQFFDDDLPF